MQAPSLIIPVKTQTKFKQWLELLSTNSFGRAQLLHVKLNFGEKKTSCFSKFEQCSNCGQNGVLSSYKMYLKYLDYVFRQWRTQYSCVVGWRGLPRIIFDKLKMSVCIMACSSLHVSQKLLSTLIFQ